MPAAIDVLIPAYNAASTLASAIGSMTAQTFRDIRIVVVDDGSTDDSPAVLRELAAADPRIHVITTPNGGIVDALNTGLAACDAELIARFDADDLAFPERLTRQKAHLDAHPECVAVGCSVHHIDQHGQRTGYISHFRQDVIGDPFHAPALEPYLLHPFLMVRRRALVDTGGYRYVFHSEDADLYWRLAEAGTLANLPDILGEYRIHPDSVSAKSVLNGRVSAVNSQLAALSQRRRRQGLPDIAFPRQALQAFQAAQHLAPILAIASNGLSKEEKAYLEVATAAKLLELSSYRPYRLEKEDLQTIRRLVKAHYPSLSAANRREIVFGRMLRHKRLATAAKLLQLAPWGVVLRALADVARDRFQTRFARH